MDKDYENRELRTAFSTPAGILALGLILADAGFFDCDLKPEDVYAENKAKTLLARMGIFNKDNFSAIVSALINLPVGKDKE